MEVTDRQCLRVIRSAEMGSPGEEADDLLELIENQMRRRRLAEAVTLAVSGALSPSRLQPPLEELELAESDVYVSDGMLGLADLMQLATLPIPDLSAPPSVPAVPSLFGPPADSASFFAAIDCDLCTTRTSPSTRPSPRSSTRPRRTPRCSPSSRRCTAPRRIRPFSNP